MFARSMFARSTAASVLVSAVMAASVASTVFACSRATWLGGDGSVITGRSMDWPYDFNTHFYVIPRGTKIVGMRGCTSPRPISGRSLPRPSRRSRWEPG